MMKTTKTIISLSVLAGITLAAICSFFILLSNATEQKDPTMGYTTINVYGDGNVHIFEKGDSGNYIPVARQESYILQRSLEAEVYCTAQTDHPTDIYYKKYINTRDGELILQEEFIENVISILHTHYIRGILATKTLKSRQM